VVLPDMPGDNFYMVLALSALSKQRTTCTFGTIRLIFPVALLIGGRIPKFLSIWTDIGIPFGIIVEVALSQISFFTTRPGVRQARPDSVIDHDLCDMRCFVPSICSNGKRLSDFLFDDIQQRFENMAVMDIPGCHDGGEEETVPVRGCVTGIGEFLLPLVFYVIATFGIG